MSGFSHHEGCPACGSQDNVGVWEDGHKWCFGCGWGIPAYKGMSLKDIKTKIKGEQKQNEHRNGVSLPFDFTYSIPAVALNWLHKYGLTAEEINRERCGWSDSKQFLIFPVFDLYDNLLLWQGRYFGNNEAYPKYYTSGTPETVFDIMDTAGRLDGRDDLVRGGGSLVLVEDYISAIKVGRQFPCMCLFGSEVSMNRIQKLSSLVTSLVIWLDRDKLRSAIKARFKALAYLNEVVVIVSELDPKEYSNESIRGFITRSRAGDLGFSK